MLISKIISGGQTGVDRGAIEAALELGPPGAGQRARHPLSQCSHTAGGGGTPPVARERDPSVVWMKRRDAASPRGGRNGRDAQSV